MNIIISAIAVLLASAHTCVSSASTPSSKPTHLLSSEPTEIDKIRIAGIFDFSNFYWIHEIFNFTVSLINNHTDGWHDDIFMDPIEGGTILDYSIEDSRCNGPAAAKAYWSLRDDGTPPHGVVGCRCSSASAAVAQIAGLEGVTQISPVSTSAKLSDKGDFPFFSRLASPDNENGEVGAMVSMLRHFGWSRVTLIGTDTQFAKDYALEFSKLWIGKHDDIETWEGEIAYSSTVILDLNGIVDDDSVRQVLDSVPTDDPSTNSRIILLIAHEQDAFSILEIAFAEKFQPDTIWVGPSSWTDGYPSIELPDIPGYIGITPYRNRNLDYQNYLERLQNAQRASRREVWTDLPNYAVEHVVDSIVAIAKALSLTPKKSRMDGHFVTRRLRELVFDGVSGIVGFTDDGDRLNSTYTIVNLQRVEGRRRLDSTPTSSKTPTPTFPYNPTPTLPYRELSWGPTASSTYPNYYPTQTLPYRELSWENIGSTGTQIGSTNLLTGNSFQKICFAQIGCSNNVFPTDRYPEDTTRVDTWVIVVIPTMFLLLLVVLLKYWRSRVKKKYYLSEMEKKLKAMGKIDAELLDINNQVEVATKRQASLILKRAELLEIPGTWTNTNETIVDVTPNDSEYWDVFDKLKKTKPDAYISRLWRVQNKPLLTYYSFHKDRLSTQGFTNEHSIWHGTSALDPAVIYDDQQDGFMMQFAEKGFWGRGIYFAEKSIYSHDYAYRVPQYNFSDKRPAGVHGEREMFLTKFLAGNEICIDRNESRQKSKECKALKIPPTDPSTNQRYHTVTGNTGGSQVWIVYENGRAYPEYLVRYYCGNRDSKRTPFKSKLEAMGKSNLNAGADEHHVKASLNASFQKRSLSKRLFGANDNQSTTDNQSTVSWRFRDDNGWKSYSIAHQRIIESAYQAFTNRTSPYSTIQVTSDQWTYEVNVNHMNQKNIEHSGHKKRDVERKVINSGHVIFCSSSKNN